MTQYATIVALVQGVNSFVSATRNAAGEPVSALIQRTSKRLDSRLEAELLICKALGVGRSWVYAHGEATLTAEQQSRLEGWVRARERGEPIAYLLGYREFYGRPFVVSPAVLIPRPETELLVDCVLGQLHSGRADIADVGAGSGCIALTLAAERPDWHVVATDLSDQALAVCQDNAVRLGLDRVERARGDLLAAVPGRRFDAIVSNPPYVAEEDPHLNCGDLRFEPALALASGPDGLTIIRRLVRQAPQHLKTRGWLFIEHGYDQAQSVRQLLSDAGFIEIASRQDLAGIERVTFGQYP